MTTLTQFSLDVIFTAHSTTSGKPAISAELSCGPINLAPTSGPGYTALDIAKQRETDNHPSTGFAVADRIPLIILHCENRFARSGGGLRTAETTGDLRSLPGPVAYQFFSKAVGPRRGK